MTFGDGAPAPSDNKYEVLPSVADQAEWSEWGWGPDWDYQQMNLDQSFKVDTEIVGPGQSCFCGAIGVKSSKNALRNKTVTSDASLSGTNDPASSNVSVSSRVSERRVHLMESRRKTREDVSETSGPNAMCLSIDPLHYFTAQSKRNKRAAVRQALNQVMCQDDDDDDSVSVVSKGWPSPNAENPNVKAFLAGEAQRQKEEEEAEKADEDRDDVSVVSNTSDVAVVGITKTISEQELDEDEEQNIHTQTELKEESDENDPERSRSPLRGFSFLRSRSDTRSQRPPAIPKPPRSQSLSRESSPIRGIDPPGARSSPLMTLRKGAAPVAKENRQNRHPSPVGRLLRSPPSTTKAASKDPKAPRSDSRGMDNASPLRSIFRTVTNNDEQKRSFPYLVREQSSKNKIGVPDMVAASNGSSSSDNDDDGIVAQKSATHDTGRAKTKDQIDVSDTTMKDTLTLPQQRRLLHRSTVSYDYDSDFDMLCSMATPPALTMEDSSLPPSTNTRSTSSKVRFAHPPVTSIVLRPRTKPEDVSRLFFSEEELEEMYDDRTMQCDNVELVAAGQHIKVKYRGGGDRRRQRIRDKEEAKREKSFESKRERSSDSRRSRGSESRSRDKSSETKYDKHSSDIKREKHSSDVRRSASDSGRRDAEYSRDSKGLEIASSA